MSRWHQTLVKDHVDRKRSDLVILGPHIHEVEDNEQTMVSGRRTMARQLKMEGRIYPEMRRIETPDAE